MKPLGKRARTDRATCDVRVFRLLLPAALLLLAAPARLHAQPGHQAQNSPPGPSTGNGAGPSRDFGSGRPGGPRPGAGQHLPQWFAQHAGQAPAQQEDALRREPGFARLPEGQQQQLINRLHRLDTAPPAQRQRMLERNERFEALPTERQGEIRAASQALREMPPERRDAMRQAFRELRALPPEQRENALGSARTQAEYSPGERSVLRSLLSIEPYHPPQ